MACYFRSKKYKNEELLDISKQIKDLLSQCVGSMETVPSLILYNIINESKTILKETVDDSVVAAYILAVVHIIDSKSYSEQHRKLREIQIPLTAKEKRNMYVPYGQEKPKTRSQIVSDFLTSPLLQNIIAEGDVIPAVVERIHVTESDEALSALSKLVLNFVKMADEKGIATMTGHHLLDGIDSILIRCQSEEGLLDAIKALRIMNNIGTKIAQGLFQNWQKEYRNHCFEAVLTEIVVGNRTRGIAREKINFSIPSYRNAVDVQCEVENVESLYDEIPLTDDEKQQIRREMPADIEDGEENEEEEDENEKSEIKQKKQKGKNAKDSAKAKPKPKSKAKAKAVGKSKTGKKANEESEQTKRKQGAEIKAKNPSASVTAAETSASRNASSISPISFQVRIEAALALVNGGTYFGMLLPMKSLARALVEGIRLPDGIEEEYLKKKNENLPEAVGSEANDEGSYAVMENAIRLMNGKIDIPKIQHCIFCIDSLAFQNVHTRRENKLSDSQVKELMEVLIRLSKFPDGLFFNLSSHCIESLCAVYRSQMKQLFLSVYEKQLVEDLKLAEEEMKKIVEAESKMKEEKAKEVTMEVSTQNDPWYYNSYDNFDKKPLPFNFARKPSYTEFESKSEYDLLCMMSSGLLSLEKKKYMQNLSQIFVPRNTAYGFGFRANKQSLSVPKYHYSLTALRVNHSLNVISCMHKLEYDNSDEIAIKQYFEVLVSRMARPFPLIAPTSVGQLSSAVYQLQSLESIQNSIDLFVLKVMTNVVKELPFVFKMGFVNVLFEWLANGKDSNASTIYIAIQIIRETCIVYMDISRQNRIDEVVPYNESVVERNKYNSVEGNKPWMGPQLYQVNVISVLEKNKCYDDNHVMFMVDPVSNKMPQLKLQDFTEDACELSKRENIGAYLLRFIDDAIEEYGIRDLVESTVQSDNIQLFWKCSGGLPTINRKIIGRNVGIYDSNDISQLPLVEFEMTPVDLREVENDRRLGAANFYRPVPLMIAN
eukprot:MONOS_10825.1-p1 / transcript=MONOS_10825.1 / gene=MONOS_10825 / organism=Monocercomonoides_exilis_PA203 / gene_product=unspecified product / transcript_product=unspecified product / location=Mono_scaffold00508:10303-13478(+) / protein_length=998 / sequence_SO=supercontig / SO=protein_coding / is_pseudo=false